MDLYSAVRTGFGDLFRQTTVQSVESNHTVYERLGTTVEISVVAQEPRSSVPRYSLQVEHHFGEPEFDILFMGDDLTLAETIATSAHVASHFDGVHGPLVIHRQCS